MVRYGFQATHAWYGIPLKKIWSVPIDSIEHLNEFYCVCSGLKLKAIILLISHTPFLVHNVNYWVHL